MRPSILLVGNDPLLLQTRGALLRGEGDVVTVTSRDAEDALTSQLYDLVVLCQTVPEDTVRRLIDQTTALDPCPIILTINRAEEPRQLEAETYYVQLTNPKWLRVAVVGLLV
jgi:CheY-like chemotaxis protein